MAMQLEFGKPHLEQAAADVLTLAKQDPADFCTIEHRGHRHFFYIERRLTEGTPFYPGHEICFGHASTADFFHWQRVASCQKVSLACKVQVFG